MFNIFKKEATDYIMNAIFDFQPPLYIMKESTTDVVFAIKVISMLILSLFLWPPVIFKQRKTFGTKDEGSSSRKRKTK